MNEVTREKLSSQTGEGIVDLRQRLGKKMGDCKKALSEQQQAMRAKAQEAKASAEACLREKPWTALGIAAGMGLVLGALLRRRN